jgi:hypothetical protein
MDGFHYVYFYVSSEDFDDRMIYDRYHRNKDAPHHVRFDVHSERSDKTKGGKKNMTNPL